ncbi:MAG: ImmA/IrrE family metallo-endopeptidase [Verrucomicrobia subdivision 3 bacterium]|nr:ImmA/IrrE family metallo-endopeptidase [Limisphaerales bacterium]
MSITGQRQWQNPSVNSFAGGGDPIELMLKRASSVALDAMQEGWSGPPFDPFALADFLHINVVPNSEVLDARTLPLKGGRIQIEYNPNRPRARVRYSVAHEIAHTFFPDCAERVRHRGARQDYAENEWELEMLCNLGAAELLMPTGSLAELKDKELSIREVLELRKRFEVSTESVLLRLIRVTQQPYVLFVASRPSASSARYRVDYSLSSRAASSRLASNALLPKQTVVSACTASGYCAEAEEEWPGLGKVHLECVGVSPYPESVYPRVIGLLRPSGATLHEGGIQFVTGDATEPRGTSARILAHVVNDATPNWGAGFGRVVQQKWPVVQQAFRESWFSATRKRLGDTFFSELERGLTICQMVCQHGYGVSERPRIRYAALRDCLLSLRDKALAENASVHMPRVGTGEAGGSWPLISALIDEVLCAAGLSVTIYDLPGSRKRLPVQRGLFDRAH